MENLMLHYHNSILISNSENWFHYNFSPGKYQVVALILYDTFTIADT